MKSQSRTSTGALGGRVYLYHNTMFRDATGGGSGSGIDGVGWPISNIVSRNNVLLGRNVITDYGTWDGKTDLDHDLYSGRISSPSASRYEQSGIKATPVFDVSLGIAKPMLASGSPGHDKAVNIPGFNHSFAGAGPDMGAHERPD